MKGFVYFLFVLALAGCKSNAVFVPVESVRTEYRDNFVRDSVVVNDTVRVPYPVEIEKRVKYVSGWQSFQIWCGRILLGIIVIFLGVKYGKKFL